MFGLFKRTKIAHWEIDLLTNVIRKLPSKYHSLDKHFNADLPNRVNIVIGDIPGYVNFSYHGDVYKKFENSKGRNLELTGMKVLDKISGQYLGFSIFINNGLINGYAVRDAKKYLLDVDNVEITDFKPKYLDNADYKKIARQLSPSERKLINPSDVYEVELNDKIYYHIKDLEDGDFVALDDERKLYQITQDPFEIRLINSSLQDILNKS